MLSIIIPVSNQVEQLRRTLRSLVPEKQGHEIVVADGGSRDGSLEVARSLKWVRLLKLSGSIATCVNTAAAKAKGEVVLILPPGVTLQRGWSTAVEAAAAEDGFALGAFRAVYDSDALFYRFPETVSALRTRFFGLPREEQALFFRRDQLINGRVYLELEATRDFNLARRLRREGRFKRLALAAVSPAPAPHRMPSACLCKAATFWSFVSNRPLGAIDRCERDRKPFVVVLVESPEPGRAPGWMRKDLGEARAADVYGRSVDNVLRVALDVAPGRVLGFYRPSRAHDQVVARWGDEVHWLPQTGRGKPERYLGALREAAASSSRPVILLDPLFPGLTPQIIRKAVRALGKGRAVIGPNGNGGCYLLGLRPGQFDGLQELPWARTRRADEVAGALIASNTPYRRLAPGRTLETIDDLADCWARGWMGRDETL